MQARDGARERGVSRRAVLKTGAAAAGALALGGLAPGRVLGASDRIRVAVIGCGGMGTGHLGNLVKRAESDNIQVTGVCDVYQRRLTRAKGISSAEGAMDYRRLLERSEVDAVLIATPDHWHAKIATDALSAGKHVYVEKPMTHTVEQAIALRNAVRRYKKVLQVGPQGTGSDSFWQARAAIAADRIGQVTWAHASYNRNARTCLFNDHGKIDALAGPGKGGEDRVDWEMWLGHRWGLAPKIPWNPEHFFRFRKYWPYNGGVATDLLYHKLAPLLLAIAGPDGAYPVRVSAGGGLYVEKDGRDIPDTFLMTVDYPGAYTIFLVSTLTNDTQLPDRIYGKHGTMDLSGQPLLRANGEMATEFKQKNDGKEEVRIPTRERKDMVGNFLDAIRTGAPLHCNVELGTATMVAIKMGVEAYRQRRTLAWDAERERVVKT